MCDYVDYVIWGIMLLSYWVIGLLRFATTNNQQPTTNSQQPTPTAK
jgi:hypothetical protein